MPTREEIKREYGEEQAKLLNELAALSMGPLDVDIEMSGGAKERLGPKTYNAVLQAEGEAFLHSERHRLKTKYEELDVEMRAALQVRMEEVQRELTPKNATFKDFAAAAEASPEGLIFAMDMALDADDEDAALLAFQAGRQRDLEEVVSHAITVREDWAEFYSELAEIEKDEGLELDPGDRFEMLAEKVPSKGELRILGGPQPDINIYGQMR